MAGNIISCIPTSYGKYPDKAYEHMAKMGVRYVELAIPDPQDTVRVRRELDKHGLSVASLAAPCSLESESYNEEFKLPIKVAEEFGTKRILVSVHAGDLERKTVYERLRELGDLATSKGCILLLETHPDLATNGDVARQTMKNVNHPDVRINFDTGNIYYYNEGVDGIEEMKKTLEYIEGVHLKDTNGKPQTIHFPALGEGIVNFSRVRELLNNRGFFGPFTIEIEGIEGEKLTLEQTLERMEKSVNHLKKCGF